MVIDAIVSGLSGFVGGLSAIIGYYYLVIKVQQNRLMDQLEKTQEERLTALKGLYSVLNESLDKPKDFKVTH